VNSTPDRTQPTADDWGSPDTGWCSLSEQARRHIVDCGILHWRRLHAGVTGYNKQWRPLRPVIMTGRQLAELHRIGDRIAELVLQSCRRRATTAGELRRALGVPAGRIHLLDDREPLTHDLLIASRPSILVCGGVPKFVEVEAHGPPPVRLASKLGSCTGCVHVPPSVTVRSAVASASLLPRSVCSEPAAIVFV
jgi:hypothetical protein